MRIQRVVSDFFHLFYPNICHICHNDLADSEKVICSSCLYHIPRTKYWLDKNNPVAQIFWGRVFVENACSFFFFAKGSKYRKLLHFLKYQGRQEIGVMLGREFGFELTRTPEYASIDYIIPVPLHPNKLKQRGFNQSQCIGQGLAEVLGKPMLNDILLRVEHTQTQTKKTRLERIQNVKNAFKVSNPEKIENKHILLVDDVITTGATLEVCASTLLSVKNVRVSLVSLAYANG